MGRDPPAPTVVDPMINQPAGYGGTAPSSSLELLDVASGYAFVAPPRIWGRGARNAVRSHSSPTCLGIQ